MTLSQLAQEIERQHEAKRDLIAPVSMMHVDVDAGQPRLRLPGEQPLELTQTAHHQLAEYAGIPRAYYDRMMTEAPLLLADNVNRWLIDGATAKHKRMIRTLDGRVRGIMSNSFRPLDNYDLADAVLPALREAGAKIESCAVTDLRMYIKATLPQLDRELPMPAGLVMGQGHTIFTRALRGAISISNSEVGYGRLVIAPAMLERQCTNLATFKDDGFAALHLGKKKGDDENVQQYLTDATKRLEDAAIWAKARDVIKAICDGRVMDKLIEQMTAARADRIEGDVAEVIEVFGKRHDLNETERGGLLRHLIDSGETTRYGLQWAVTRLAQDVESYDRATELERLGGKVIELPKSEWREILKAAA